MTIVGLINYKLQITIQIVGSNFVLKKPVISN
jgi:hypothetical protein